MSSFKKRIMCYGDSNTWGYIPVTGNRYDENTRWTSVLQKQLGENYTVIEEGLSGRTSAFTRDYDPELNGLNGLGYALKSQAPLDAVIVMLGTNDLIDHTPLMSANGVAEIVRRIVNADSYYRVSSPIFRDKPKLLLVSPPHFHPCVDAMTEMQSGAAGKYNASLQLADLFCQIAKTNGADFLDASDYAEASEDDGIHLTAQSHFSLGIAIAEKVKDFFGNP